MDKNEVVFNKNITNKIIINALLIALSIIVASQSSSFLFNPFILVLFCLSYIVSFYSLILITITTSITGLMIYITYGLELLLVGSIFIIFYILARILFKEKIKIFIPFILSNLVIFLIYFFTSNGEFYRINSIISLFISLLISYSITNIVYKTKIKEEPNQIDWSIVIGCSTLLFFFEDRLMYLWLSYVLLLILRSGKRTLYNLSLLSSLLFLNLFNNVDISIFFVIYLSFFFVGCITTKHSYFLYVPIVSFLFLSINSEFYLDNYFYQLIIGFLLVCLTPEILINKIKLIIDYQVKDQIKEVVEYQSNKLNQISKLCDLLMDERFDKIENLDEQMERLIKKEVCQKCSKQEACCLNLKKYLNGYCSNDNKVEINNNCIYPYQVIKSITNANKRILDYSERELKSVESKKIMNNVYQIIKKYISLTPKTETSIKKYSYEYEIISKHASNSPNGDYYYVCENQDLVISLSDGMGHTEKSRDISQYVVELIDYLLKIANDYSSAIESCNQIVLAKTYEEVYATLDICKINLETANMHIYKAGSFPTFIIRNKTVIEISSKLPPLGIINNIVVPEEKYELKNKDIVIFMTDGYGNNVYEMVQKTIQKATFLPLKNYVKFLHNQLNKELKEEDDQTIIGIKIIKN